MQTKQMTYDDALAFIHNTYGLGKKNGLSNMRLLLDILGKPQDRFASVHVAGTNGKGSVCAYINAALCMAGYKTGLYTSPFLQRYNERMRVNGAPIPDDRLAHLMERVSEAVLSLRALGIAPTEFEIGTALAFLYFAAEAVDVAVIEVGMGGRLDPTNVILPKVSAIASIGFDHMSALGNTLPEIAFEKAGIAKPSVPLVLSAQTTAEVRSVIKARCAEVGAPFSIAEPVDGVPLGLPGEHQRFNAGVARAALVKLSETGLPITQSQIIDGFRRVRWPGRLEWVKGEPPILMDGAHNPEGVEALARYVDSLPKARTVLLCGIMKDKDWQSMSVTFSRLADAVVTVVPDNKRALDAKTLSEAFHCLGVPAVPSGTLPEALAAAKAAAGPHGRVVAGGSLYLIGSLRTLLLGRDDALMSYEGIE